jgi:hypothetical protein
LDEEEQEEDRVVENPFLKDNLALTYTWDTSSLGHIWNFLMGFVAFFDFCATAADRCDHLRVRSSRILESVVLWLLNHTNWFNMLFSLMWFLDAFVTAERRRVAASRRRDRQRLLKLADVTEDKYHQEADDHWWKGDRGRYWSAILIQVLFLPVGFYVFCYHVYRKLSNPGIIVMGDEIVWVVHRVEDDSVPDEVETFTADTSICLAFAVLKHLAIEIQTRTRQRVHFLWVTKSREFVRRLLQQAVRNPIKIHHRIRDVLRYIRWARYTAPLIGQSFKLRANVGDLERKYFQRKERKRAQATRKKLRLDLSSMDLRDYCAVLIQKTWRSYQARKRTASLNFVRGEEQHNAATKFQSACRQSLIRARVRLRYKHMKLKELQEKETAAREKRKTMDANERRYMYVLQQELNEKTQTLLNKKLLLRPNTGFVVAWKVVFLLCIFLEIARLSVEPFLQEYKDEVTGKPWGLYTFLGKKLIPEPVSQLDVCKLEEEKSSRYFSWIVGPLKRTKGFFWSTTSVIRGPPPWYCGPLYSSVQAWYITIARFTMDRILAFVGFICFLDVPISFFTGEINPETGLLEPKPFFQRWFVPGLLLQLAVNPQMEGTSKFVLRIIESTINFGPVRVGRWTIALFYPVLLSLARLLRRRWRLYVADQNGKPLQNQTTVVMLSRRASSWRSHRGSVDSFSSSFGPRIRDDFFSSRTPVGD